MPKLGTYSAWIEVDGEVLPEYGVVRDTLQDGTLRVSCWVPSSAGKEFVIFHSEAEGKEPVLVGICVDGFACGPEITLPLDAKSREDDWYLESYLPGVDTEHGFMPFQFGNCRLVEEETDGSVEGMGEITVSFSECIISNQFVKPSCPVDNHHILAQPRELHERAKKGIVHCVRLGQECLSPSEDTVTYGVHSKDPHVYFRFQYRPLDFLRAEGIAPRDPAEQCSVAEGETIDSTLDSDSEEERSIQRLKAEVEAMEKRRAEKKRKRAATMSAQGRNVKRK